MNNKTRQFKCNDCLHINYFIDMKSEFRKGWGHYGIECPVCESENVREWLDKDAELKKLRAELAAERECADEQRGMYMAERGYVKEIHRTLSVCLSVSDDFTSIRIPTDKLVVLAEMTKSIGVHIARPE